MNHTPGSGGASRDPPVELRCTRCRTAHAVADLARARPSDDPHVTLECPGCGAVLDVGPHGW